MKKEKFLITLPIALKKAVIRAAAYRGCSQAEIIRTALYDHLREFVEEGDQEQRKRLLSLDANR